MHGIVWQCVVYFPQIKNIFLVSREPLKDINKLQHLVLTIVVVYGSVVTFNNVKRFRKKVLRLFRRYSALGTLSTHEKFTNVLYIMMFDKFYV